MSILMSMRFFFGKSKYVNPEQYGNVGSYRKVNQKMSFFYIFWYLQNCVIIIELSYRIKLSKDIICM